MNHLKHRLAKLEGKPVDQAAVLQRWRHLVGVPDLEFQPWMLLTHEERLKLVAEGKASPRGDD